MQTHFLRAWKSGFGLDQADGRKIFNLPLRACCVAEAGEAAGAEQSSAESSHLDGKGVDAYAWDFYRVPMKTRVTLALDPEVSHRGKLAARARGTTFPGLVEQLLIKEPASSVKGPPSFGDRWQGKLVFSEKTGPRLDHLKKKYQLGGS
jgi:hypothetical protein